MICILLSLLIHVLWPRMWSILVNVPYEFEVSPAVAGCSRPRMSINYIQLVDSVAEFNYVLTDFLPPGFTHF